MRKHLMIAMAFAWPGAFELCTNAQVSCAMFGLAFVFGVSLTFSILMYAAANWLAIRFSAEAE